MNSNFFQRNDEIPPLFYSDVTGQPFCKCSVCEDLLDSKPYVVEKAFKRYANSTEQFTVFELAICLDCRKGMMSEISKESMANIQNYVQENMSVDEFMAEVNQQDLQKLKCLITGEPIENLQEYQIVGIFRANKMIQVPMVFSEIAISQYADILSEKTKGFFDDFMDRINDLPPSIQSLLNSKKSPVII